MKPETPTMDVSKQDFRDAMSNFAAAVNIITTDGPAGRAGITASSVCSVCDTPPTVLICVNTSTRLHDIMARNGVYCVNVLSAAARGLSDLFSQKVDMETRFLGGSWSPLATGAPALEGAAFSLDCRIVERILSQTHTIFIGEVVDMRVGEGEDDALVYYRRAYRHLSRSPAVLG
jgi:flavin reductase